MITSQYDKETRRQLKLEQRSPAYRELQRRSSQERALLERKLHARNEVIARLKKKLLDAGVTPKEVEEAANLAA